MKSMKKIASLVLAMVLAFSLMTVAFAADETYTITIKNDASGYTYAAYQIFAGTLYEETTTDDTTDNTTTTKILSDITWGSGITEAGQAALQTKYNVSSAAEMAAKLEAGDPTAHDFAVEAGKYISEPSATSTYADGQYTISGLDAGYYLVKNTEVPNVDGAYTSYILEVVSNVEVDPKESVPTSNKTLDDINDSTETERTGNLTSSDYDIGDDVNFTLTHSSLQSDYADYETYVLIFHDVMSEGLTFNASSVAVTVTTDGTEYTMDSSSYTVVTDTQDDCTFEIQITDLKTATSEGTVIPTNSNSTVTVTYTGTLNSNAVIGNPGNPNTMYTEYSDNPYASGSGNNETDRTPDHTVAVFTYQVVVNKVDQDNNPLTGAEFTLYKYDETKESYVDYQNTLTVDTAGTTFTATGLDDGMYKIVETKTPDGYNSIDDIFFTVTAVHTEDSASKTGYSTTLTVTVTDADGNALGTSDLTFSVSGGTATTSVVNQAGSELPSTGGIGTTIFYIIGGVLVAGAVVVLITRRRMSHEA